MLIINADDLGRDTLATDTCLNCHRQGRITSSSIMVFMADSIRAAKLAIDRGLETGLHVNLVLPYDDPSVPDELRRSQGAAVRFFRKGPWTQVVFNPLIMGHVARTFNSQLDEYRRLFGRDPAHFNGHKHFHLSLNMAIGGVLPEGAFVRRSFTFSRGEKSRANRFYRELIDLWLTRKHQVTDAFFSIHPFDDRHRLVRIVHMARNRSVELMVHPWDPDQYAFIMSREFGDLIESVPKAGYLALKLRRDVNG